MSDEMCKKDIRALLKTFGVSADEAIVGHMAKNPGVKTLNLKVTLEVLTNYGCLLYTSPSPRDREKSRMPSSA